MDFFQDIVTKHKDFIQKCADDAEVIEQECDSYFKEIDRFLKTENIDFFKPDEMGKENIGPTGVTNKRKGRLRKPALADVTETNILQPDTVIIKKEKISIIQEDIEPDVQIKKETDEMPAPRRLPPRLKKIKGEKEDLPKRSTRTRTKKTESTDDITSENANIRATTNSDVIIENTTITTIEISDNEKEIDAETEKTYIEKETRNTRSKMKVQHKPIGLENPVKDTSNKELSDEEVGKNIRNTRTTTRQKKRSRSISMEHTEKKRSKSNSGSEKDFSTTRQTEYEDAVSAIENNQKEPAANSTYIASSKKSTLGINENIVPSCMNSTVVVENPKIVTNTERLEERPKTPQQFAVKDGNEQIFSPSDKTPVKEKIEAFERLEVQSSGIPLRTTGTKKKLHKNSEEENQHSSKLLTPVTSNFLPKVCSTSKIGKQHPVYSSNTSTNSESILSVKSASALKASQAEFREREKRRQEKEREALRKKEALLQAQTEEKRRKREEKQQKAQHLREIKEKEMQKQLEAHRIKEEKFKLAMAERDKKLKKQNEEAEKKRQLAKKKANELRKEKEEAVRMAEMKVLADKHGEMSKMALKQKVESGHQQSVPIYMITKPPLLPTADCYDSDNPEYDPHSRVEPAWARDKELREMQLVMITAGETIKNSFFCRQTHTPDLQEIFEKIDPRKLKRTSSAFWRKPPRYTLMPMLEDTIEFSEDSD